MRIFVLITIAVSVLYAGSCKTTQKTVAPSTEQPSDTADLQGKINDRIAKIEPIPEPAPTSTPPTATKELPPPSTSPKQGSTDIITGDTDNSSIYTIIFGSSDSEFLKAVKDQDLSKAASMLRNRQNPNVEDSQGNNAIFYAIRTENISMANTLLEYNINVAKANRQTQLPMIYAVSKNNIQLVGLLKNGGASITAADVSKITPMIIAVKQGNDAMVRYLLENGARVTDRDANGNTLLHIAIENNNAIMVRLLLDKNADVYIRNNQRKSALDLLKSSNRTEFKEMAAKYEYE